jgi:crotonobetainyl-CoA:carnitine CoA-transferase CaiB-like acyl-CoA transferase
LTGEIEQVLGRFDAEHWQRILDAAGVPASAVNQLGTALTSPQSRALGALEDVTTPEGYPYRTVRPPLSIDGTLGYSRGAPSLGQHTAEVLKEFGLDAETLDDLVERRIVAP